MDREAIERVERLFNQALDAPDAERRALLRCCRGDDPHIVVEVESLLASYDGGFLAKSLSLPAHFGETAVPEGLTPVPPDLVGPYKITRLVGEGGMARVYEGWQEVPLRRKVAVKVIKNSHDDRQVAARFESERQTLAQLEHPYIVKVFDAGTTMNGQPYFAMEFVEGCPITRYCDERRLGVSERLDLFLKVCRAVQHAHVNATLHRDLKPSNVLVTVLEGEPIPKVIDFGVARALAGGPKKRTLLTEAGQLVGTPEYMSPEQIESDRTGIDARTDVYGLGVLLYELLAGRLPFVARTGGVMDVFELMRRICTDDPPPPSSRVDAVEHNIAAATSRCTDPRALVRALRGDLDAIVTRALAKRREDRYGTVAELAADIERHIGRQPIVARPANALQRMLKFCMRHPVGTSFSAGATMLLALFITTVVMQSAQATRQRDRAEEAVEYLLNLFHSWLAVGAAPPPGERPTLDAPYPPAPLTARRRQLVDQAAARVAAVRNPTLRAQVASVIARIYAQSGSWPEAISAQRELLQAQRVRAGDTTASVAATLGVLSDLCARNGEHHAALRAAKEALAIHEKLGSDDTFIANDLRRIGTAEGELGRFESARSTLERSAETWPASQGPEVAVTLDLLALFCWRAGKAKMAVGYVRRSQAHWRGAALGEHPRVALNEVFLLAHGGQLDAAFALLHGALEDGLGAYLERDDPELLTRHPGLAPLRGRPAFDDLVRDYRKRAGLDVAPTLRLTVNPPAVVREGETVHVRVEPLGDQLPVEIRLASDSGFHRTFTAPPFEAAFVVPRGSRRVELTATVVDGTGRQGDVTAKWDVKPPDRAVIRGRVTDGKARVAGAVVWTAVGARSTTDSDGAFRLETDWAPRTRLFAAASRGPHRERGTATVVTTDQIDAGDIVIRPLSSTGRRFFVDAAPVWLVGGDFDSDGFLDLVTVLRRSRYLTLLTGDGAGSFEQKRRIEHDPLALARRVAAGDFDGNGALDLISASQDYGDKVAVHLGRGDGTFESAQRYAIGINHESLVVSDVDGDGRLDVLVGSTFNYPATVLYGAGDGSLGLARNIDLPRSFRGRSLELGDVDGDGRADLLVPTRGGVVEVWTGSPDGSFYPGASVDPASHVYPAATLADLDTDGNLDVVVGSNAVIRVFLGDGRGDFRAVANFTLCPTVRPTQPTDCMAYRFATGDLDGDGIVDLVISSPTSAVHVALGRGDGTLAFNGSYTIGARPGGIVVEDFDGDGLDDVVVGEITSSTVTVLLALGDGRLQAATEVPEPTARKGELTPRGSTIGF